MLNTLTPTQAQSSEDASLKTSGMSWVPSGALELLPAALSPPPPPQAARLAARPANSALYTARRNIMRCISNPSVWSAMAAIRGAAAYSERVGRWLTRFSRRQLSRRTDMEGCWKLVSVRGLPQLHHELLGAYACCRQFDAAREKCAYRARQHATGTAPRAPLARRAQPPWRGILHQQQIARLRTAIMAAVEQHGCSTPCQQCPGL